MKKSFPAEHAPHYTASIDLPFLPSGSDVVNAQADFSQLGVFSS